MHGRLVALSGTVMQIVGKGVSFLLKWPVEGSVRALCVISYSGYFLYEEKIRLRMKVASYKVMM